MVILYLLHYSDVIMGVMASQITSLMIVYSTIYSGADQRKHESSASLAFVWGIDRWPVNSPHKWPVMRKMFPFDLLIFFRVASLALGQSYDCPNASESALKLRSKIGQFQATTKHNILWTMHIFLGMYYKSLIEYLRRCDCISSTLHRTHWSDVLCAPRAHYNNNLFVIS